MSCLCITHYLFSIEFKAQILNALLLLYLSLSTVYDVSVDANVDPSIGLSFNVDCSFNLIAVKCSWEQEEPEYISNILFCNKLYNIFNFGALLIQAVNVAI